MEFLLQPFTLLTFFPLLGVLVLFFIPSDRKDTVALDDTHHNFDHVRHFALGADDVQRLEPGPATGSAL